MDSFAKIKPRLEQHIVAALVKAQNEGQPRPVSYGIHPDDLAELITETHGSTDPDDPRLGDLPWRVREDNVTRDPVVAGVVLLADEAAPRL